MVKGKIEILAGLLAQFFEKKFDIPAELLHKADRFLFHNEHFHELQKHSDLYDTLVYLKDVKDQNFLKDINELTLYYEKKQHGIDELFDKYEQARAEEQLAIKFQNSYETFLKIQNMETHTKSESLYYPMSETNYLIGYENISYRNSIEEEILYLAKVKGNQLAKQPNVSRIVSEKNNQLTSN